MISLDKVTVDYVFKNQTDKDVETLVAFPMPDIDGTIYDRPYIPDDAVGQFPRLRGDGRRQGGEADAGAEGLCASASMSASCSRRNNVPVNPFTQPVFTALEALSEETAQDWINRGLIFIDSYDDGSGWKNVRTPLWSLKSTYWWNSTFPAGKEVKVSHRYKPSVGGTSGLNFFYDGKFDGAYERLQAQLLHRRRVREGGAEGGQGEHGRLSAC